MADISKAMGPEGKVALGTECLKAMTQMEDFRNAAKGLVQQVQGTVNGLRADYSGEGAEKFYAACESNIQQINAMIDNICNAYAAQETGLFHSIHNQLLASEQSLNTTLATTNGQFTANSDSK